MNAAVSNSFLLIDQPALIKPGVTKFTPICSLRYRDEDEDSREDWFNPSYFDDPEDDDQLDSEPFDNEIYDDFALDAEPDDSEPPPDELWNDADWE